MSAAATCSYGRWISNQFGNIKTTLSSSSSSSSWTRRIFAGASFPKRLCSWSLIDRPTTQPLVSRPRSISRSRFFGILQWCCIEIIFTVTDDRIKMKYSIASQSGQVSTYITVIKDNVTSPTLVDYSNSSPVPLSLGFRISLIIAAYNVSNFNVIWRGFVCDLKSILSFLVESKYFVGSSLLGWRCWKETLDICSWEEKIIIGMVVKA
jgi:hypothetical protein